MSHADKLSCCIRCHFEFEEDVAFEYLPQRIADKLQAEHDQLRELDYPPAQVDAHAESEMQYLRRYCPPDVLLRIEADHVRLHE